MARVFVYGTLKRGQPNYHRMLDGSNGKAEFVASALTVQPYPLVIASAYNVPFLLNLPGQGQRVHGEIYSVDERMLEFLDEFESVPTMYQRTSVQLEVKEWAKDQESPGTGSVTEAFVYSTTTYQPEWRTLPTYDSYDSFGSHGLQYTLREARD